MPHPARRDSQAKGANRGKKLSDERLLDLVQRQTFRYFWEAGHPVSGLARDRCQRLADPRDDMVASQRTCFSARDACAVPNDDE